MIGDLITNLFNAGYSVYQDQRNYQYQKDLQKELFARDDNAMQRRMADYKAAGINPLMALGSSAAGNSSAGSVSSTPVSLEPEFFSKQETAKVQRQAVKDEIDKRQYEKDLLKLQLKSGKIANLQALQDLNMKNLEYKILQNQLLNYENNDYWPSSSVGKIIGDVSQILSNNLPFSPLKPGPSLFNLLLKFSKNGGIQIDPSWIDKLNGVAQNVQNYSNNIINKAEQKSEQNQLTKDIQKAYKNVYPRYNDLQSVWNQFNNWNKNKNIQLHFIRQKGDSSLFNPRGYFMIYNKRTKKYYSPKFYNFESINRFLNYGNVKY